jgi:hypothetical protein
VRTEERILKLGEEKKEHLEKRKQRGKKKKGIREKKDRQEDK